MSHSSPSTRSLSELDWQFAGYTGEDWRYRNAFVSQEPSRSWHPATVPGSVHWDLLRAGQLADPYRELQSLSAEWVSQRQWVYAADLEVPEHGGRTFLRFEGIDYLADAFLDGEHLGRTSSLFAPAVFELSGAGRRRLSVVLREAPLEQSQIGYSSQVTSHKPRMSYGWDFAPRLVHLGIWGEVSLLTTGSTRIDDLWVRPVLQGGRAVLHLQASLDGPSTDVRFTVSLGDWSVEVGSTDGNAILELDDPALWWTNGTGEQPLYTCRADVVADERVSDSRSTTFGIRDVRLVHNADRTDALPYTLEVNGQRIYTKGWNWVPVDAMYGRPDLAERYADLVELARRANINLLRVWGGGLIERDLFYDLCDRAGILVWQEFVQSSSGLDNEPPTGADYLASLTAEARTVIATRRNHPSLALWCGGNELEAGGRPIELDHPNISALHRLVTELDPDRAFVPSSPSGPIFYLDEEVVAERPLDQHDVHGPWDYRGPVASYSVYESSTALFHSEFGTPGAIARASLDRFIDREAQWPPDATNPPWVHHGSWWLQRHWIDALFGPVTDLDHYVLLSQWVQADVLGYALDANRRRWPTCSGTLPWQFNEPWPNAHCTSAVDYYLRPKPAYWSVRAAYARVSPSLRHSGLALGGSPLHATVHVCADDTAVGELRVTCHELDGTVVHQQVYAYDGTGALELGSLDLDLAGLDVVVVRLETPEGLRRHYVFSSAAQDATPLAALYNAVPTKLGLATSPGRLRVTNDGPSIALFPVLDIDDDELRWSVGGNAPVLLPGESWETTVTAVRRRQPLGPHAPQRPEAKADPTEVLVTVQGWNLETASVTVPL